MRIASIPGLKPRAIKCRRFATKTRKTYVYGSLSFFEQLSFCDSQGCGRGTVAIAKTAHLLFAAFPRIP